MSFKVHKYRHTRNIGDAMQTVALQRLLPSVTYAWRDEGHADDGVPFVVNGWLGNNAPDVTNSNCLFAGVFVNDNESNYQWMGNSRFPEIGARDPATVMRCADRGIRASFIGCATLTFERYTGPRSGVYAVHADAPRSVSISHDIGSLDWEDQLARAEELLDLYRRAEMVVTSRLHAALPCLAFGTPVVIMDPLRAQDPNHTRRFSILDAIGARYDVPITMDVTLWRDRYVAFLERNLRIQAEG